MFERLKQALVGWIASLELLRSATYSRNAFSIS